MQPETFHQGDKTSEEEPVLVRGRNSKVTIYSSRRNFQVILLKDSFWCILTFIGQSLLKRKYNIHHCQVVRIWQNITRSAASKRLNEKQQKLDEFLNFEVKNK